MLKHVPPWAIEEQHLRLLLAGLVAPLAVRPDPHDILRRVHAKQAQMYTFPQGLLVLEVHEREDNKALLITAFAGPSAVFKRRALAQDLRRLAADWRCDTIETTVFDRRLSDAICSIGGKIESITVTLGVKG